MADNYWTWLGHVANAVMSESREGVVALLKGSHDWHEGMRSQRHARIGSRQPIGNAYKTTDSTAIVTMMAAQFQSC